jgi:tRNA:m4X modification enzyme
MFLSCYAGRGMLGLAVALTYPDVHVTMVDGTRPRNGADSKLRDRGIAVARAKIDIRDLNMSKLPLPHGKGVVLIAKHLCGVGTDLALRALKTLAPVTQRGTCSTADTDTDATTVDGGSSAAALTESFAAMHGIAGVALATCCHHCCNLQDAVGHEFMTECGFTKQDVAAVGRIGGWVATYSNTTTTTASTSSDEHTVVRKTSKGLHVVSAAEASRTPEQMVTIGRKAKRLIDYARVQYLRSLGLHAEMIYFCEAAVTPENCLIIASQKPFAAHSNNGDSAH